MAIIYDLDLLNQGTEVEFDIDNRTIGLNVAGNLTEDGVTLQCVYSFTKTEWKKDSVLIGQDEPFVPIDGPSGTQFILKDGWSWRDVDTINLLRNAGFAVMNTGGVITQEWCNITSLGLFHDKNSDRAYYTQGDIDNPIDTIRAGEVNQCVQIFGDADNGNFDKRSDFVIYLREEQKTYGQYDLIVEQNISALTYKQYTLPLSNKIDTKVTHTDAEIEAGGYENITITYYDTTQQRDVGGTAYDFSVIVEGNNNTLEEIYEKHQYIMRQESDIDNGDGVVRGDTADTLMYFEGDTLYVRGYIDNVLDADSNRVVFIDDTGVERVNPFTSAGVIETNAPLQVDDDAEYWMFFSDTFNTSSPLLVNDANGNPITGLVSGLSTIPFNYDYDGNNQRGDGTEGTDAPVKIVAIGLNNAQHIVADGIITRSKSLKFALVANQEMTFVNP